ncbi:hypothetical protein DFJ73DRAFT_661824, partial [Zopfochytrium polystomum]
MKKKKRKKPARATDRQRQANQLRILLFHQNSPSLSLSLSRSLLACWFSPAAEYKESTNNGGGKQKKKKRKKKQKGKPGINHHTLTHEPRIESAPSHQIVVLLAQQTESNRNARSVGDPSDPLWKQTQAIFHSTLFSLLAAHPCLLPKLIGKTGEEVDCGPPFTDLPGLVAAAVCGGEGSVIAAQARVGDSGRAIRSPLAIAVWKSKLNGGRWGGSGVSSGARASPPVPPAIASDYATLASSPPFTPPLTLPPPL